MAKTIVSVYQSTTIADVVRELSSKYVLPALQRDYVWKPKQIEKLFDSIMREYPINTFMFWKVYPKTFPKYLFYNFLDKSYVQDVTVNTVAVASKKSVLAVIDGQQRLTSLMIGLVGSYTTSRKIKKHLCLNLSSGKGEVEDDELLWEFEFLTDNQLEKKSSGVWIKVSEVWLYQDINVRDRWIAGKTWADDEKNAVRRLWNEIFVKANISFYEEDKQDLSVVLDEFLRSNNGGTKLEAADLVMSQLGVGWSRAKDAFKELRKDVKDHGYDIDVSTILKAALVCCANSVKFTSVDAADINRIQTNWTKFSESYLSVIQLLKLWGLQDKSVDSKNALAILVYFVYKFDLSRTISSTSAKATTSLGVVRKEMEKWLVLVLLKGAISSSADTVLTSMKKIIDKGNNSYFPYKEFLTDYKVKSICVLDITPADINAWLSSKKNEANARLLLNLFCPPIESKNTVFDIDHLHSKTKCLAELEASDAYKNYDMLPNLTRQDSGVNRSKGDRKLDEWYNADWTAIKWDQLGRRKGTAADLLLEDASGTLPLNIDEFADYYARREKILREAIDNFFK